MSTVKDVKAVFITVQPRVSPEDDARFPGAAFHANQRTPPEEGGPSRPDRFVFTFVYDDGTTSVMRLNGIRFVELQHAVARAMSASLNGSTR